MITTEDLKKRINVSTMPRELQRLERVNLWGVTHSTYRSSQRLDPHLPKSRHVLDACALAYNLTTKSKLEPEEKNIIIGEVAVHDVNTTGCTCHFDRGIDNIEVEILCSEIRGEGPFSNSTLPEWINSNFGNGSNELIAREIEQKGRLHRIAEGIENLSHILLDAIPQVSDKTDMKIRESAEINEETGGLIIPPNIIAQPHNFFIKEFISHTRKIPLEAYIYNKQGVFYEGILRNMMETVIESRGRDVIYTADDREWYEIFLQMNLDPIQRQALEILQKRRLPAKYNGVVCYNHVSVRLPTFNDPIYENFKMGKRRDIKTKLEAELSEDIGTSIYLVTIENSVGEEHIHVNGEDFPELRLLSLGVYGYPGRKPIYKVSRAIQQKLLSTYFGPLIKAANSNEKTFRKEFR